MSGIQASLVLPLQLKNDDCTSRLEFAHYNLSGLAGERGGVVVSMQHTTVCGRGGYTAGLGICEQRIARLAKHSQRKGTLFSVIQCVAWRNEACKWTTLSSSCKILGWDGQSRGLRRRSGVVSVGRHGDYLAGGGGKGRRGSAAVAAEEVDVPSRRGSPVEAMTRADTGFVRQLQRFLASAGLPLDTAPSPAELAKAGRQDLANGVHRRGEDVVSKLLANVQRQQLPPTQPAARSSSSSARSAGPRTEPPNSFRIGDSPHGSSSNPSRQSSRSAPPLSAQVSAEVRSAPYSLASGTAYERETPGGPQDSSLLREGDSAGGPDGGESGKRGSGGRAPRRGGGGGRRGSGRKSSQPQPQPQSDEPQVAPKQLSLQERAALFLRTGSLKFEGSGGEPSGQEELSEGSESESGSDAEVEEADTRRAESYVADKQSVRGVPGPEARRDGNGSGAVLEDPLSTKKATLLKARLQRRMQEAPEPVAMAAALPPLLQEEQEEEEEDEEETIVVRYSSSGATSERTVDLDQMENEAYAQLQLENNENLFRDILEKQREIEELSQATGSGFVQREHEMDEFKTETQKELERIKTALHAREMELASMSRELEEAKAQLALMRAKATAELAQAQQAVVEKDVLLRAAEAALANLKHVRVEWWGEGSRVELAGSFNGWQYFVPLEPDLSSEIPQPDGTSGPMMWGIGMRLYPGIYEVKFIVDGRWEIDIRREVVTRSSNNQNNILRVE